MQPAAARDVAVDNFTAAPAMASVPVGTTVTWTNRDDVPHTIVSTERKFKSPVLDTDEQFLLSVRRARNVQVLLLDSSDDDGPDRRGVSVSASCAFHFLCPLHGCAGFAASLPE
jgi:plastocyanin